MPEFITLTIPRSIVSELPLLAHALNERMHDLLQRNTDSLLNQMERTELETLVRMAHFAQILTMAAQDAKASAASSVE